jgi:uncharacterized membrane protein
MGSKWRRSFWRQRHGGSRRLSKSPGLNRRFAAVVVPVSILLLVIAFWIGRHLTGQPPLPVAALLLAKEGQLRIPLSQLTDHQAHYYECELSEGRRARFFTVLTTQGSYRVALDGCEGCEESRYYPQGRQMVCTVCGKKFSLDALRDNSDNPCEPVSVPNTVQNANLIMQATDISKAVDKLKT